MKRLIFVRHGKAEDPTSGICDYERSLTLKGKIISRLMARKLKDLDKTSVLLISSPAFRAIETALVFATELGIEPEHIILDSKLYYKMNMRYLPGILSTAGDETETVIMFGHNPSLTEIAGSLASEGCEFLPKSGIVSLTFDTGSWNEIEQKSGKLEYFLKPENVL